MGKFFKKQNNGLNLAKLNDMKPIFLILAATLFFTACNHENAPQEEQWQALFNGKDLTGWTPKIVGYKAGDNFGNTFRVEDGILKVSYAEYDSFNNRFGHLFYEKPFSHYKLRIEYRFTGSQATGGESWAFKNSGVMFHGQSAESMGLDQGFPVSLEAQFLGGTGEGDRPTGNLCTPGMNVIMGDTVTTMHCISSTSPTFHGEEWITFEVVAMGNEIMHHIVNGDTVITYRKPTIGNDFLPENYPVAAGTVVTGGYISLQSESHPIEFRKVEILDLSKPEPK